VTRLRAAEVMVSDSLQLPGSHTDLEEVMSRESRMFAGILLVILPTVMYGGLSLLSFLTRDGPGYNDNPLLHDLWRAPVMRTLASIS